MPEKVPEKTPGAWLTKLSMMAPGLREEEEEEEEEECTEALVSLLGLLAQLASGQGAAVGVLWGSEAGLGRPGEGWWERLNRLPGSWEGRGAGGGGVLQ